MRWDDLDLAALFTRTLAVPDLDDLHIEDAFDRVVELAKTAEYQRARRALYDWERSVVAGRWDVQGARAKLVELTLEHDALVRQYFRDRWVQRGVCVAAVIVPPSVGLVGGAVGFLGGLAASGLAAYATARAPKLTDPYSRPGAALSMAMDAVWKL